MAKPFWVQKVAHIKLVMLLELMEAPVRARPEVPSATRPVEATAHLSGSDIGVALGTGVDEEAEVGTGRSERLLSTSAGW